MWHTFQTSRCGKRPGTYVGFCPARGNPRTRNGWAPRMAELNAVAAREAPSESALEELYWKLHLHRTEDELKTLGQNADLELSQQQELQRLEELRLRLLATLESVRAHAPDR